MLESTLNGNSADILAQNIDALRQLFPEVICEDKVDFDKLRQILGDYADDTPERYNFTWNGKGRALRLAQSPSTGTLRPCKEESKNWDATKNLYIEGDNLEVLKLLQKTYHGKVKMIYIDPPYNTGNDFVYPDDYADNLENYLRITGQRGEDGGRLSTNTEASGRYHTNWLNMMYPRLRLARNLLRDDGVIFISIDDNEVAQLRKICDEVFGEINFVAQLIWKSKSGGANDSRFFAVDHEYILVFAKNSDSFNILLDTEATVTTAYNQKDELGEYSLDRLDKQSIRYSPSLDYVIIGPNGEQYTPKHKDPKNPNATWRWGKETVKQRINELVFKDGNIYTKNYKKEGAIARSLLIEDRFGRTRTGKTNLSGLLNTEVFQNPKPYKLVRYLEMIVTNPNNNDLILDFFSGSATTAHAVMQLNAEDGGNRKFIMVQLQESCDENSEALKVGYKNICEIGKERIRRAGDKIKAELAAKQNNKQSLDSGGQAIDPEKLDIGFKVFKLNSSNLKKWQPDRDNLEDSLYGMVGNYIEGRTELDVAYEIMLKYGVDLTLPLEEYTFGGKKVYSIGFGALVICLDDDITTDIAKDIVGLKAELEPETMRVVMKDNGFVSDSVKTNVKETLKSAGIDEFVTV